MSTQHLFFFVQTSKLKWDDKLSSMLVHLLQLLVQQIRKYHEKTLLILLLLISTIVIWLVLDSYSVPSIKERAEQGLDHNKVKERAEQGLDLAQYNLGWMYHKGVGVVKDYIEAFKWSSIAISRGEKNKTIAILENLVEALTSKMTGAQISEAMRRATEWVKSHDP